MTVKKHIAEWLVALFFVIILFMLVRPGSPAADLVTALSQALTALTKLAVSG